MLAAFRARDGVGQDAALLRPRYNIRPTERVLAVALEADDAAGAAAEGAVQRVLRAFRWGFLPPWARDAAAGPPLINARSETIAEKPAFAESARRRRCLVPADGFYEWRETGRTPRGRALKTPYWITRSSAATPPLAFAGVWREWIGPDGDRVESLAIVTCAANKTMSPLHERLPVAVASNDFGRWLGDDAVSGPAAPLMRAPGEDFYVFHPVSERIGRGGREAPDDADLIRPVAAAPASPKQGTLF